MVLILEVPLASIAIILSVVSWKTLQAIKHLAVGKAFWIPMMLSGIFFFAGSIVAIFSDLGVWFTASTEVISMSRLLALSCLAGGVYAYSRKITKNLVEKFTIPVLRTEEKLDEDTMTSPSILNQFDEKPPEKNFDCKHRLGYLRSLPRGTLIPEECEGCHRIIDCKFSLVKETKSTSVTPPASTVIPNNVLSEVSKEEETKNQK
ncbi:MAG TPA: hypothetical protein VJ044_00720 [Candidatus Hodarchaeales archaeon]|nr:hypothetical protein [Candidatus Hodarchaeales archaeon]